MLMDRQNAKLTTKQKDQEHACNTTNIAIAIAIAKNKHMEMCKASQT